MGHDGREGPGLYLQVVGTTGTVEITLPAGGSITQVRGLAVSHDATTAPASITSPRRTPSIFVGAGLSHAVEVATPSPLAPELSTVVAAGGIQIVGSDAHGVLSNDHTAVLFVGASLIFADGFESGDLSAWSSSVP